MNPIKTLNFISFWLNFTGFFVALVMGCYLALPWSGGGMVIAAVCYKISA